MADAGLIRVFLRQDGQQLPLCPPLRIVVVRVNADLFQETALCIVALLIGGFQFFRCVPSATSHQAVVIILHHPGEQGDLSPDLLMGGKGGLAEFLF